MRGDINACPICGSSSKIYFTPKASFDKVFEEHGEASLIISCYRCGLDLWGHDRANDNDYSYRLKHLIGRWNNMPRKEDVDDGR